MKAIIPAAGMGTRFLPVTKAQPKEMLPVVDKPIMQYVVEEAVQAGAEDILLVTGRGKRVIEDHFDRSAELEQILAADDSPAGTRKLELVQRISTLAELFYVRQKSPKGLGHAIHKGAAFVGNDPFYVLLGDVIVPNNDVLPRLKEVYERTGASAIAVERVEPELVSRYGIIDGDEVAPGVFKLNGLVEKPDAGKAPSNLAIVGRYLLTPQVMDVLAHTKPGNGGEIQLTDALTGLLATEPIYAVEVPPHSGYDTGNVMSWLGANVALALKDERFTNEVRHLLEDLL
jgi:UTP--glucose-1-phosphate uridylyltransferase